MQPCIYCGAAHKVYRPCIRQRIASLIASAQPCPDFMLDYHCRGCWKPTTTIGALVLELPGTATFCHATVKCITGAMQHDEKVAAAQASWNEPRNPGQE